MMPKDWKVFRKIQQVEKRECRNAKNSPLLLLPAELREQIWEYAFGWRTIYPRMNKNFPGSLVFNSCPHSTTYRMYKE